MTEDVFRYVIASGVSLATLAMIVQAVMVLGIYRTARTVQEKVSSLSDRSEPILDSTKRLLEESRPRIKEITDTAAELAATTKAQVARLDQLLTETSDRARVQIERIDNLVEDTVGRVQETTAAVQASILKPVREVNGVVSGVRAAIAVLRGGQRPSVEHATQDEEMFI